MRKYANLKEPIKLDDGSFIHKIMLFEAKEGFYLFEYDSPEAVESCADLCYDLLEDLYDDWNDLLDENGWIEMEDPLPDFQHDAFIPLRVKGRNTGSPEWGNFETLKDGIWVPYEPGEGTEKRNDNATPLAARDYDAKINQTIPFYTEFYDQTLDVVTQCGFDDIRWLDLGCGTGTLEEFAIKQFPGASFVLVDPSEKMLEQAKEKLAGHDIEYLCAASTDIGFEDAFEVVTAIQSHHYMQPEEREKAVANVYRALKSGGIFVCFENVIPEDEAVKARELLRWGRYQQRRGKTAEEALAHNARCGVNYFPLTVAQHIALLQKTGFAYVHVFWISYMQMGIYGIK